MSEPPLARLLIVDDEEKHMKALRDTLQDQGYSTSGFTSATQAIAALAAEPFDLLLTDMMMPEMDGITFLNRALAIDPHLVGIVMTGQGSIDTAVQAMKAGALDYILKPFKLSAILPVLSRALAVRKLRLENLALETRVRERTSELEAANQDLEAFSYSVSHDLQAPLRHIRSYVQILKTDEEDRLSPEGRQFLTSVLESSGRMAALISSLLEFARVGRTELRRYEFSVQEVVEEVLRELKPDLEGREINWQVEPLPQVLADRTMLKQVWVNLIANAVKYSRHRRPAVIQIGCRTHGTEFEFFVRDNGAGFDMRYADRLFGVFQRLHGPAEFEGTGIGLANVRRIITRHGGRTWAEAKVDQGAVFYFSLNRSANK
jgi:two-component system, sensor histidine kinase and response regulator